MEFRQNLFLSLCPFRPAKNSYDFSLKVGLICYLALHIFMYNLISQNIYLKAITISSIITFMSCKHNSLDEEFIDV